MIVLDTQNNVFTLHTKHTTYQMKADQYRVLLHTYYGPRVSGGDLSYLIQFADRGASPNPNEAGHRRDYSLETLPQEYSTCGVGDFRLPSLEFEPQDGSHMADLRYVNYQLRPGKYSLEGLPAFWGDQGWETLVVCLEDPSTHMQVELYYGVLEERDLITRAVRVVNRGNSTVRLHRCASLCLDLQRGDFDLITFDGCHAQERNPHRAPLRHGVQSVESVRGTSSHHHNPFVVLCDQGATEDYGLCYGAALLYSGNFLAVLLLAGLQNISKSYYEAASIDGAGKVTQFFHITLPMVSPTLFVVMIMRLMASVKVYDLIYMMVEETNPAVTSVQSLMYLFYRESFVAGSRGSGSAIVIWTVLLIGLVTVIQFMGQKKWVNYDV